MDQIKKLASFPAGQPPVIAKSPPFATAGGKSSPVKAETPSPVKIEPFPAGQPPVIAKSPPFATAGGKSSPVKAETPSPVKIEPPSPVKVDKKNDYIDTMSGNKWWS
jgi:hypothetical protein